MINIREVRYGNYITSSDQEKRNNLPAWQIYIDDFIYIFEHPDNYEGIPLTEEWLLKFGFYEINKVSKSFGIQVSKKQFIFVKLKEVGNNPRWKISHEFNTEEIYLFREVEFVHDLQNIFFALTGKELIT